MADTEEYFPRGGKKPTTTYFKQSANFLGAPEKGEKKRKKPKKKAEGDDGYLSDEGTKEIDQACKNCSNGLSYKTIKEGVLILGRVKDILETKVVISLPCRMIGSVMACHISEPYNKLLEDYVNDKIEKVLELREMFRVGQYVAVKVLEVKEISLMLTLMPQHINGQRTYADLQKGNLMQAAVTSVEDHGYVMDIGVADTRAFLPKTNTNPELELDVGMVCWCCIKSLSSSGGSVVSLSNELEVLQNSWLRQRTAAPLLPGSTLDFLVDTPLENGIEGHVFGDTTAYIQRQHADTVKGKKPALGQKIRARLLYVMPTRNTPFLTMKSIFESTHPDMSVEQKLKDGDIVEEATVLKITGRSIHFRLGGGCYGTMSLKRIQIDEDLTDEEVVAKSYPIGSSHKVRVLCYNLSDYVYSVSDEAGVLTERYFSLHHLHPGDLVDASVRAVGDNHLVINIGRVTAYVPQAHAVDSGVIMNTMKATTSKLKKKFKVGQAVQARVLTCDAARRGLFATLKPSLLAPDLLVLASYEAAEVGRAYTGVIKTIRDFVLVSFFNNVVAYVPKNYVTKEPIEYLSEAFHIGQIVKCTILWVDAENKKMSGSLTTPPFWPAPKRKIKDPKEVPNKKQKKSKQAETHTEESDTEEDTSKDTKRKKLKPNTEESEPQKKDKKKKGKQDTKENTEQDTVESDQQEQSKKSKKKKKKQATEDSDTNTEEEKAVKNKKKKKNVENTEDSDAIETDIYGDNNKILNPQDARLLDFTTCTTPKQYKKRVVSLLKAINNKSNRINILEQKLSRIETSGLTAQNKRFHTAMYAEKLVVEETIAKFLAAMKIGQEKLKELGVEIFQKGEWKKKKDTVPSEKGSKLEVKIVDSLEPALEAPSVKDFWSAPADSLPKNEEDVQSSSSDDEDKEQPKKKRKKLTVAEKVAKAREEEERLRELERRAVESEAAPRSSEHFERALLASPNCSQLWIAYMAFHLQATELDKARNVARRALSTISFREESEKLNVWLAMINFETRFGTKESQQKTVEEALQMNEPFAVHSKLLDIYVETGRPQELSSLVELMLRKYKRETSTYTLCGAACFKLGLADKARQVMQKAITVLEKKEHVSVLVQFALLERAAGGRERAEALFEQVLAVYPQRVDVCAAYVDMLLKAGDAEHVRQVMERMTSQKLPARKMKILYKKWIEVEEKIGDQEQVEKIKQRALQYVEKAKF